MKLLVLYPHYKYTRYFNSLHTCILAPGPGGPIKIQDSSAFLPPGGRKSGVEMWDLISEPICGSLVLLKNWKLGKQQQTLNFVIHTNLLVSKRVYKYTCTCSSISKWVCWYLTYNVDKAYTCTCNSLDRLIKLFKKLIRKS